MQITYKQFISIIKPSGFIKVGLVPGAAYKKVANYYCNALTNRSACSEQCATCLLDLKRRLNEAKWDDKQSPYALYTYFVKQSAATLIEQAHTKPAVTINPLTEPVDALDMLLETLA